VEEAGVTFDPAWFAAVTSTGALIITGILSSRLRKLESRLERDDATLPLPKYRDDFHPILSTDVPPGTRMPEMDERKS
jgi:hypothetical protein